MKKIGIMFVIGSLLLLIPMAVYGLNTPGVGEKHGVITLRQVDTVGLVAGGEFGLTDEMAITADLGEKDYNRTSIKYQFNPDLAISLGVTHSQLFLGFNPGVEFTDNINGVAQFDIYNLDSKFAVDYEVGIIFGITRKLDIRLGLLGTVTEVDTTKNYQLGMGYQF